MKKKKNNEYQHLRRLIKKSILKFESRFVVISFEKSLLSAKILSHALYLVRGRIDLKALKTELEDIKQQYINGTINYEDYCYQIEITLDKTLKGARD